jgi:glycoprotein-N-acetylgalactosamine 3-beta-galactosyltransferase
MENVRRMLYQYRPETALYFGDRFAVPQIPEGYMSGGGYILSKKAVEKFVTKILPNNTICNRDENGNEDWELGSCLRHSALSADDRDEFQQKRMFALSIMQHLEPTKDMKFWYDQRMYYDVVRGNLKCCSKYPVGLHYINVHEMYFLEYLTRKVYPFGYDKKINETLPRKFRFDEVVAQSDYESKSPLFVKHPKIHYFDHEEKY